MSQQVRPAGEGQGQPGWGHKGHSSTPTVTWLQLPSPSSGRGPLMWPGSQPCRRLLSLLVTLSSSVFPSSK